MLSKNDMRRQMKELLSGTSPGRFRLEGEKAAARAVDSPLWSQYERVLLFLSMEGEIDTAPLLEAALGGGKKVFVPRVEGKDMVFLRIFSTAGPWRAGVFGIREPAGDEGLLDEGDFPALVFVPALAYDREGRRLGRGGGFYDRFLGGLDAQNRPVATLGLCMECQLVEEVPIEAFDKRVNSVLAGGTYLSC